MYRKLTVRTELKLARAFWRDLETIKSYFWPIVQIKHVNKVFPPFPIAAKPVRQTLNVYKNHAGKQKFCKYVAYYSTVNHYFLLFSSLRRVPVMLLAKRRAQNYLTRRRLLPIS